MIIDLFLMLILHYKNCTDDILQIKNFELNQIKKNGIIFIYLNFFFLINNNNMQLIIYFR